MQDWDKVRLALYQPDIPQNVGAAMRLAACFGAPMDIIEPCGFALTDKGLRRTAMDYGELALVKRHASWSCFRDDMARSSRLILLTTQGAKPLWEFSFHPDDVVLCGRESAGVPPDVHNAVHERVVIPLSPAARSLNVVTAAAVALAEASRQLGLAGMAGPS